MTTKTYRAFTMAEALGAVKRDLGSDAVILRTRTFQQGGFLGFRRKTVVEVVATKEPPKKQSAKQPAPVPVPAPAARGMNGASSRSGAAQRAYGGAKPHAATEPVVGTGREAAALLEQMLAVQKQQRGVVAAMDEVMVVPRHAPASPAAGTANPQAAAAAVRTETARRYQLSSSRSNAFIAPPDNLDSMQAELAQIRTMVSEVLQRQPSSAGVHGVADATPKWPRELLNMYVQLAGQELAKDLAESVIEQVKRELSAKELKDASKVRRAVLAKLMEHIPCASAGTDAMRAAGRPFVLALVGPTGVGKTTTLAKLAADLKLRHKRKVVLVTADTYRIAAVEQLRTYAEIIGVPLHVAMSPEEMRETVDAAKDADIVLIDTAGRSQKDRDRLRELRQFVTAASPDEVHLVLSSTASERVMIEEAEAFSTIGVDRVVFTKLDEAVSFGILVNVMRRIGKSLSFLTTGQEVPEHLEVGRSERLAELLLGAEARRG